MQKVYSQVQVPRRGAFYFAFAVAMIFVYMLSGAPSALPALLAIGLFISAVIWFAFRRTPSGMEITAQEWRFFLGERRWRIPLADIVSVSVVRWEGRPDSVALTFRSGRTDILPDGIVTDVGQLTEELARRGIRVVS